MRDPHHRLTTVAYARVAAQDGGDRLISEQLQELRRYAGSQEMVIREAYADLGRSGATLDERPGLRSALQAVEWGVGTVLLVRDLDRLSRDVANLRTILDKVEDTGGRVCVLGVGFVDPVLQAQPRSLRRRASQASRAQHPTFGYLTGVARSGGHPRIPD